MASVRYATAEVILNKGVRINGEVGTVLSSQLITPTSKTTTDERGWSALAIMLVFECYSGASDKGPSKKGITPQLIDSGSRP